MKKEYLIQDLSTKKYIDWYSGSIFVTGDIDSIRNGLFSSYDSAELFIIDEKQNLRQNYKCFKIVEILTFN